MRSFKRIFTIVFLVILIAAAFAAYRIFGANAFFKEDKKAIFIKTGSNFEDVEHVLAHGHVVSNTKTFRWFAKLNNYDQNIKPGKYVFEKGASLYTILKTLKSGKQAPVNLVITKLRTNQDLATKLANSFESDSMAVAALFSSNDSLKQFDLDTNTAFFKSSSVNPIPYSIACAAGCVSSCVNVFEYLFSSAITPVP